MDALQGAIKKWQKIIDGKGVDNGEDNCPLCKEYKASGGMYENDECEGCPVWEDTGLECCYDTPYIRWCEHQAEEHSEEDKQKVWCKKCISLATKEKEYLEQLLKRRKPNGNRHGKTGNKRQPRRKRDSKA